MSRNEISQFSEVPVDSSRPRSKFQRDQTVKTSFNVGELVPFYFDTVYPGDTHSVQTSKVVRTFPLVTPVMDNLYLDTYYFFVPRRLCWEHWREFCGENTASAWTPSVTYTVPQVTSPSGGWSTGTIADYMGIPVGVDDISIDAMPFRAYALICDQWFRDQNVADPLVIPMGDSTTTGSNGSDQRVDMAKGGKPFIVSRFHDYFSSCLPSPQKGPDVRIPTTTSGAYPVIPLSTAWDPSEFTDIDAHGTHGNYTRAGSTTRQYIQAPSGGNIEFGTASIPTYFDNLYAVSAGGALGATINELRMAFAMQRFYEKCARGGTRYREIIAAHFGVNVPDSRVQIPEYLGGNRIPLQISQQVQTSNSASGITPQGTVTGYSHTVDTHGDFSKSFTEHGFIIGVCCVRYDHTYQQGIPREFLNREIFDFYWPSLAHIGEQGVRNAELYAQGAAAVDPSTGEPYDDGIFGYQEAWAHLRYKPNIVSGKMRSAATGSLDSWHFADDYASLPTLSATWMREDKSNVDRALTVASTVNDQIFGDFVVENTTTRELPMYSVPGLLDHM